MSASSQCPHPGFDFNVDVQRFTDDTIIMAEITGHCTACGKPVTFRGRLPMGVHWDQPTISVDATELRLPVVVEGDQVDESKARPSFGIDLGTRHE